MIEAVYFDLDGTLTDPKPGIARSIQYALRQLGRAAPSEDELTWCIGPPLRNSLVKLLGGEALADDALTLYRGRFSETGLYENSLYPGIAEVLHVLVARNIPLFVATSKPAIYAKRIVTHFGLDRHFHEIFGSELDGTRSDKTELLRYALAQTGTAPERTVMIGDRSHDMIGACNNAMRGFGVLYGYGSKAELMEAGAERLFATPQSLEALID